MTASIRRLYSIFAFVVFCVTATVVVGWSNGYRFTNWKSGLVRSGALFVTSEPRATLFINGEKIGQTPQRLSRLAPGIYSARLEKTDYGSWSTTVKISSGLGQVIGPVFLFPQHFTVTSDLLPDTTTVISTKDHRAFYTLTQQSSTIVAQQTWPNQGPPIVLPWLPTSVSLSPDSQTSVFFHQESTIVYNRSVKTVWQLPVVNTVLWDEQTPTLFYGLHDGELFRYDARDSSSVPVIACSSYTLIKDTLWYTSKTDEVTSILKQSTFGQQSPTNVFSQTGNWVLLPEKNGLFIRNTQTLEVHLLRPEDFSTLYTAHTLGEVDAIWWRNGSVAPIWLSGNDTWTLDAQDKPKLIDRLSTKLVIAEWLIPNHILLQSDGQAVTIESVSSQQGRGSLLTWRAESPFEILGIDVEKRIFVIHQTNRLVTQTIAW